MYSSFSVMEWLNQNSEALQVFATFVLVVVTILYVVLIHRQLEASGRSSLNVFVGHANMETSLEIENVGPGAAFNIKLEPNRDFTVGKYKSCHDIGVIKNQERDCTTWTNSAGRSAANFFCDAANGVWRGSF